ncbi:thioredoxin family protein [Sulfurospirillum arcachonense]|uniref:thioredoxin family protein n=1 Tax=Sulfurospirillum arcachonense TaxID=57666 RepID=UPI00046AA824|nr:thioredoxin family protein [Sulfurospirillum arcachonense]
MKNILFILLVTSLFLYAENFEKAVEKARGTDKLILVELEMQFCPYCIRMEKSVLSKLDIKEILENKYIFVKLDIHTDEIPEHLKSRVTPTFYFLSNDGEKILDEIIGITKKSDFKFYLEETYKKRYNN